MLYVYEFEIVKNGKWFLAFPYDFEGATQGESFGEACEMAADWLKTEIEWRLMDGEDIPTATFDNTSRNGAKTVVVAVEAGLETIRRVTAAEAAKRLGVTRGRVSQMIKSDVLETFELDGRTWVTEDSVNARLEEHPTAGRPPVAAQAAPVYEFAVDMR